VPVDQARGDLAQRDVSVSRDLSSGERFVPFDLPRAPDRRPDHPSVKPPDLGQLDAPPPPPDKGVPDRPPPPTDAGCGPTLTLCNGLCVDTKTDVNHCNGCNKPCTTTGVAACHEVLCQAGVCTVIPVADGSKCDDGMYCTATDFCKGGQCTGTPRLCVSSIKDTLCKWSACNEAQQSCTMIAADGTACDDGSWCNGDEVCKGGVCVSLGNEPCALKVPPDSCIASYTCDLAQGCCVEVPVAAAADKTCVASSGSFSSQGMCCGGLECCPFGQTCCGTTCCAPGYCCQKNPTPHCALVCVGTP